MKAIRRFTVRTVLPKRLSMLDELARNLRWSWHEPTVRFFASLDPTAWEQAGHDPVVLLGEITPERFQELADDPGVVAEAKRLAADLKQYMTKEDWYQSSYENADKPRAVAYFSAEYGVTQVMPQYSGGLGVLAGDYLKAASDLGVPVTGVGLLYGAGYFQQSLSRDGWQRETYPLVDPNNLPLTLLREEDSTPVEIEVALPEGRILRAQVWVAQVGRVPLLLLDSDVPSNDEISRSVTDRLYGGSAEHRLEQELLLGVGGVKALRVYTRLTGGIEPEVYHCNEGHAGFMAVERVRELVEGDPHLSFGAAIEAVRAGTLFTTHTPVPAGIDRFDKSVVRKYLEALPMPLEDANKVLALGAETYSGGNPRVFNMAVFGLRTARLANGVSELHGETSRGMFSLLWLGYDQDEIPITSITNGVHGPTWRNPGFQEVALEYMTAEEEASGRGWLKSADQGGMPDTVLWEQRARMRTELVEYSRKRVWEAWLERGASPAELGWVDSILDPSVLTVGFARRVPTYKRLTLMLSDPKRLTRLLTNPDRPIQIVVAGKSHPDDEMGVSLIQKLVQFADDVGVRDRIVFLPNYDMAMAAKLVPGCDVWLNNPLRPLEASGTSGMKCALNGALNLSILDGWWDEMYDGSNGWAVPTADGIEDPARRDQLEAEALYDLLENTVAPRFYDRDKRGLPTRWIEMMRHTLATLGPKVQASRMVKDYVRELYSPIAAASRLIGTPPYQNAEDLAEWKERVRRAWPSVHVDSVEVAVPDVAQLGDEVEVTARVSLGDLTPWDVAVQLIAGRVSGDDRLFDTSMTELAPLDEGEGGVYSFGSEETLRRAGAVGYAVRVVPSNPMMAAETEMGLSANAQPSAVSGHTHTTHGQ